MIAHESSAYKTAAHPHDARLDRQRCRLHSIEPWVYLRDVLCLLPRWPEYRLLELSPVEWVRTCARIDVMQLLDANSFRRLTLDNGH